MPAPIVDALDVLGRTLSWLGRDEGRNLEQTRYVEDNLGIWAARLIVAVPEEFVDDVVSARIALAGFDDASWEDRAERVVLLSAVHARIRSHFQGDVVPVPEARAVLLPMGIPEELPPGSEEERAPVPKEERPRREGGESREPRSGRGEGRRGAAPAQAQVVEEPARPALPPPPPPPPPPPLTFPLGHPDCSGAPVSVLGLTPAEEEAFAAHQVATVADLLLLAPTALVRAGERLVEGVEPEGPVLLRGKISRRVTHCKPAGRRFELTLLTDRGEVRCRWLSAVPVEVMRGSSGAGLGVVGRYESDDDGPVLYEGEPLGIDGRGGDWFPRYDVPGFAEPRIRSLMRAALRGVDEILADHLPSDVIERNKLIPLGPAIRDVHFPSNVHGKGRARLAFDELFQVQLGMAILRTPERRERGTAHGIQHGLVSRVLAVEGWQLNDQQESAFDALRRDLRRTTPMERLLQGDVGSGKSAVVRAAMTLVAESKLQVFFCAADALAAEHHHLFAADWWRAAGIETLLLLGPPNRAQAEALRKGDTLVVYGTEALLAAPPEVRKLGLVVVEQSGRYAMPDLTRLEGQSARPDLLVVTPTPVPALLAMTVYGQLAMTVVDQPPKLGVDTHVLAPDRRDEAYAAAREAIAAGKQVILVFPFRESRADLLSPSEARRMAEVLTQQQLAGAKFTLFSGGLTPEERFRAYDDFQHRRADVLLATTAFEEGPCVPNASVIIAEYAEGFDLVRLHRLRNHVAAGWVRGQCYFVQSDGASPEDQSRLELVAGGDDGFRVADLDLAARGVEAALGDSADIPRFVWADPAQDRETLTRARQEAFRLLTADPGLRRRQSRPLSNLVRARFGEEPALADGAPPPTQGADLAARRRRRRRR